MPVVNVRIERLKKLVPGIRVDKALEMLPFVGLDIEGVDKDIVRIEYNPNRPDFSSDYGIARALAGLMGKQTGAPKFKISRRSGISIRVENNVKKVRPFVVALVARGGRMDDEAIRQIISMQEDLHNGLGRRRKKASIGIHNLDTIKPPLKYTVVRGSHSFVPLGGSKSMAVEQILQETQTGQEYRHLISKGKNPAIIDSDGVTISFPPIINSEETKVDASCRNLFVEVTATDKKTADDILAIMAITLYDVGFEIRSVAVISDRGRRQDTPDTKPEKIISTDTKYLNETLGLELSPAQIVACLKKCRLEAKSAKDKIRCTVPRYRTDIFHPIDLAEEVAIGYGIYNIEPSFPPSYSAGQRLTLSRYFDVARDTMAGLGMIEVLNFSLSNRQVQYELAGKAPDKEALGVEGSKSAEHDLLRDSLLPSLLQSLAKNVHEEYPQKFFEIGKAFRKSAAGIEESWNLAAVIAHGEAGYTETKSALQAVMSAFGIQASTKATQNELFIKGRCAATIIHQDRQIGVIGEVTPLAIDNFKLRVPVAAFEISLSEMLGHEKENGKEKPQIPQTPRTDNPV